MRMAANDVAVDVASGQCGAWTAWTVGGVTDNR